MSRLETVSMVKAVRESVIRWDHGDPNFSAECKASTQLNDKLLTREYTTWNSFLTPSFRPHAHPSELVTKIPRLSEKLRPIISVE